MGGSPGPVIEEIDGPKPVHNGRPSELRRVWIRSRDRSVVAQMSRWSLASPNATIAISLWSSLSSSQSTSLLVLWPEEGLMNWPLRWSGRCSNLTNLRKCCRGCTLLGWASRRASSTALRSPAIRNVLGDNGSGLIIPQSDACSGGGNCGDENLNRLKSSFYFGFGVQDRKMAS